MFIYFVILVEKFLLKLQNWKNEINYEMCYTQLSIIQHYLFIFYSISISISVSISLSLSLSLSICHLFCKNWFNWQCHNFVYYFISIIFYYTINPNPNSKLRELDYWSLSWHISLFFNFNFSICFNSLYLKFVCVWLTFVLQE